MGLVAELQRRNVIRMAGLYLVGGWLLVQVASTLFPAFGVPAWALYPMIGLSTAATVIASQAVISGGYSAARQAIQLGYLPRMAIHHTSHETIGQIYMPTINWLLMLGTVATVIGFGSSTALATAYGVSVTGTMLITSVLLIVAMRHRAALPPMVFWPLASLFVLVDVAFLSANLAKFFDGAWFPLLLGVLVFALLRTWGRGRVLLQDEVRKDGLRLDTFLTGLMLAPPARVSGTAVFLTAQPDLVPKALLHNLKHNKVLHNATCCSPSRRRRSRSCCRTSG